MNLPSTEIPQLSSVNSRSLRSALRPRVDGHVVKVVGLLAEGFCPGAAVGDLLEIHTSGAIVPAEVVGLRDGRVLMVGLGELRGITLGAKISHLGVAASVACHQAMTGRILDARGAILDTQGGPLPGPHDLRPIYASAPSPLERSLIASPLPVGVRAIDGLLTLGRGQRIGILAGAGVGKSTLLGAIAAHTEADIIVIGLVGERGREVGEFLQRTLSETARRRCVAVVATSDRPALERTRAAFVATTIAEYFSSGGAHVLLLVDSLTRFAMAQRELGLSMGEPPATRGYPPSVFSLLPRLLERAGSFTAGGSITGVYTVLVEGDDLSDPISDAARSILDGHIVLSRDLASIGHYPAIDVLQSISRVAASVVPESVNTAAQRVRTLVARIAEAKELVQIGAHVPGADPGLDRALQLQPAVDAFLRQPASDPTSLAEIVKAMTALAEAV
ncbi:MAG: FliI/YscN family ATPase [Nannocystaceae bacterium]